MTSIEGKHINLHKALFQMKEHKTMQYIYIIMNTAQDHSSKALFDVKLAIAFHLQGEIDVNRLSS